MLNYITIIYCEWAKVYVGQRGTKAKLRGRRDEVWNQILVSKELQKQSLGGGVQKQSIGRQRDAKAKFRGREEVAKARFGEQKF